MFIIKIIFQALFLLFFLASGKFFWIIQKKRKNYKSSGKNIFSVLIFSCLISIIFLFYAIGLNGGIDVEWKKLGKPADEEKALEIIESRFVRWESGKIYHHLCRYYCESYWEEVSVVFLNEEIENEISMLIPTDNCRALNWLPISRKDFIQIVETCIHWGGGDNFEAYAIDEEGNIFFWGLITNSYIIFSYIFLLIIGFLVGIVIGGSSILILSNVTHDVEI